MTDPEPEQFVIASLIAARDVALRVLAEAEAQGLGTDNDEDGNGDTPPSSQSHARPQTSSGILLQKAAEQLGVGAIAGALGVSEEALEHFLQKSQPMNLVQQRTLALAVLVLCDEHDALRRRASALLHQVAAATDFETGVTPRHAYPPASSLEWH